MAHLNAHPHTGEGKTQGSTGNLLELIREDSKVAIESADVFLVCELMMDFPCADYCETTSMQRVALYLS